MEAAPRAVEQQVAPVPAPAQEVAAHSDPVRLPRSSEGLYLMQRVRDEAHRFAITGHRARRDKLRRRSTLEEIPGLAVQLLLGAPGKPSQSEQIA